MAVRTKVTISEVAEAVGVSAQTISRVLNDRPDVSPETRQRVWQVIGDLGYRPNAIARSLIRQRSRTLGVVAMGSEYYGPSRILVAVEKQIRELGYSLLLDLVHNVENKQVDHILNRLLSQQVEGILWAVPEIGPNREWLDDKRGRLPVPIVFLSMHAMEGFCVADIDNRKGGYLATQHLISLGCERIGLITGPLEWWGARARVDGWRDALAEAGLPARELQIYEGNWSASSGEAGIRHLWESFPEIEAVFASNDQMALGVLKAMHERHSRDSGWLAVIGFDNIPESAYFWPQLSTIDQPLVELGKKAVEELYSMISAEQSGKEPYSPRNILLEPALVVRDSTLKWSAWK